MGDLFDQLAEDWSERLDLSKEQIWTAKEMGLDLSKRAKDDWDNAVVFSGEKGSSKTTGATHLGIWQQGGPGAENTELHYKKFLTSNFIYSCPVKTLFPKLVDKYSILPRFSSIVVDEVKDLHKRGFASYFNIEMAKFVGKNRKWMNPQTGEDVGNKTLIMCLDNVMSLDREVRNSCQIHIHIVTRGFGFVFRPLRLAYIADPFFADEFQKILARTVKESGAKASNYLDIKKQLFLYSKMPTFDGVFVYPNLDMLTTKPETPGPVESLYKELDRASKTENEQVSTNKDESKGGKSATAAGFLVKMLRDRAGLTFKEIKEELAANNIEITQKSLCSWQKTLENGKD